MTPQEYRKLSPGKAVTIITALVISLNGKKAFPPTSDFWRLRAFFAKQPHLKLNILFDYLITLESSQDSLSTMFEKAEKYRQDQMLEPNMCSQYDDITLDDIMKL